MGPRWAIGSALLAGPLFVAHYLWYPLFVVDAVPRWVWYAIGAALLAIGVALYAVALRAMRRAFKAGELATEGPYALCRHPIYAAWNFVIVPGALAFSRSWLLLAVPVLMVVLLRVVVRREEAWLEATFGQDYRDYKARVNAVFPRLRRKR